MMLNTTFAHLYTLSIDFDDSYLHKKELPDKHLPI